MSDQPGKELANISNPQEKISPREMDLGTAQTILRGVVSFQEQTMTENSPRDRIGEYSTEQIRQAMRLVGKDLISKYKIKEARNYEFFDTDITLNKLGRWPENKRIFLEFKYGKGESDDFKFEEISLHRHNNKKRHWPYIYGIYTVRISE